MAGGKKKAANMKKRGVYTRYLDRGTRETNKANRIVKNLISAKEPGVAAGKVLAKYAEVCKHPKADNVISRVTKALNKREITIVKPEKKVVDAEDKA